MEVATEFYVAPVDGARCLRVTGRAQRCALPVPATRPRDGGPTGCFLCHPERDELDLGAWPPGEPFAHVLGNAFPVAQRSLLVAPPGAPMHDVTPAGLDPGPILRLVTDPGFVSHFQLEGLQRSLFWNVGVLAGQSRRHPHAQVIGLDAEVDSTRSVEAVQADLESAVAAGRSLTLETEVGLVIPARPSLTAEAWLPVPLRDDANEVARFDRAVARVVQALEAGLSCNYNLVMLPSANILRILPRGISERAGLEFAFPGTIDNVVAASVPETREMWRAALAATR